MMRGRRRVEMKIGALGGQKVVKGVYVGVGFHQGSKFSQFGLCTHKVRSAIAVEIGGGSSSGHEAL
jgi:hypothetical protein